MTNHWLSLVFQPFSHMYTPSKLSLILTPRILATCRLHEQWRGKFWNCGLFFMNITFTEAHSFGFSLMLFTVTHSSKLKKKEEKEKNKQTNKRKHPLYVPIRVYGAVKSGDVLDIKWHDKTFSPGGYLVERWERGYAAQIGYLFGLTCLPMAPFLFENWFRYRSHFCKMLD